MAISDVTGTTLPRRDFVILPLLSLFTVVAMFGLTELIARLSAPEIRADSCRMHVEAGGGGDRYKPNCVSTTKLFGGPWVENRYNECGYRSRASCGTKPPGTIRLAVLGTSAATGFMVPYDQTVWGILEKTLTRQCRRPVEVQNLSVFGTGLNLVEQAHRIDEALALKPDLIVLMASGGDLTGVEDWQPPGTSQPRAQALPQKMGLGEVLDPLKGMVRRSAAMTALRYYLYQNDSAYLKIYMTTQGEDMGYLRVPFSPIWQKRLGIFDSLLGAMAEKAQAQGVKLVLVPSIFRAQVLLLNTPSEIPSIDPYAFDRETKKIAEKHNFIKFNVSADFSNVKHSELVFYPADGHFSAVGHAIFSKSVIRHLAESRQLDAAGCTLNSIGD